MVTTYHQKQDFNHEIFEVDTPVLLNNHYVVFRSKTDMKTSMATVGDCDLRAEA